MDLGIDEPVRETLCASLQMTRMTLEALGVPADVAAARVERFRQQDAELLKRQYLVYDDDARIVQTTREALADLEQLFEADAQREGPEASSPSA
jgi:glutathione-regulated potassium-efflux system protein KefB